MCCEQCGQVLGKMSGGLWSIEVDPTLLMEAATWATEGLHLCGDLMRSGCCSDGFRSRQDCLRARLKA